MPIFQHNFDDSELDDAYLALMAKPTNDEVGADIETHGHIPVTQENVTQDPFTQKGALANALDDLLEEQQKHGNIDNRDEDDVDAGDDADSDDSKAKQFRMPESYTQSQRVDHLPELHEMRTGELTGETEGCNMEGNEKMTGEDGGESTKDALTTVFDEIFAMDGNGGENIEEDDEEELVYKDWAKKTQPVPELPDGLADKDKPDANGLVYITRTFTVDPAKYLSTNYRPIAAPQNNTVQQKTVGGDVVTKEEVTMEEESSPDAKFSAASEDEPTERQEQQAAKEADGELAKSKPEEKRQEKGAEDAAPEKVVLDYATYIDGSSFCCCDEVNGIDYSKIAMDAGPKKKVTRENCQTTFAQCRAKNPLFCRFHGPKLLEADIKTAIKAEVGAGVFVSVTKDKNAKDKFTFRLTVGCTPAQKPMVESQIHDFMINNPGIKSKEDWKDVGSHKQSTEFEMDILKADKPPMKGMEREKKALNEAKKAIKAKKEMAQVQETPAAIEKKAALNIKPSNFAPELADEWTHLDQDYIGNSLLPENVDFRIKYKEIEGDYNKAYDAKDKEGVKKAIRDLKKLMTDFNPKWSLPQGPSDEPPEEGDGEEQNDIPKDGQEAVEKGVQPAPPQGIEPAPPMPPKEAFQPEPEQAQEPEQEQGQEGQEQVQESIQQEQNAQQPVQAQPQQEQPQQAAEAESVPEQGAVEPSQETQEPEQGQEAAEATEEEPKVLKLHKPTGLVPTMEQAEKEEGEKVETQEQNEQEKVQEPEELETESSGEKTESGTKEVSNDIDEAQIDAASELMTTRVNLSAEAIKEGIQNRLTGKEKMTKPVLELVQRSLPKGDPVREALEKKAKEEGIEGDSSVESEQEEEPIQSNNEVNIDSLEGEDLYSLINKTITNSLKASPSRDEMEIAQRTNEAVETAQRNEAISAELEDFLSDMEKELDGGDGTIVGAAIEDAIEDADERAEEATEDARRGIKELQKATEESYRKAEKKVKGSSAAKVEKELVNLAKSVFTDSSKSDKIGEEAESIAESVSDYAKEKGIEHKLSQPVREVIDDIKNESDRLDRLMEEYRETMQASETDFQVEDVEHLSGAIGRLSAAIANKFGLLRAMQGAEKRRIDDAVKLKAEKAKLGGIEHTRPTEVESQKEQTEKTVNPQEKIAAIYKDWVEDDVPKWVSNLTDEEAKEYVGLLEAARDNGSDEGSDALSKLEEYEESHKNAKPKKTEAKAESKKEKSEATKQNADELRKAAIQASRRLGVEAYKPDDVLEKMLETAKAHISDPRQAQRVKDIEAILADREAKGRKTVSQAEINASKAEQRFKSRTGSEELLPSEAFKGRTRDNSEGVGNQEDDDWEPSKSEINAEDSKPKEAIKAESEKPDLAKIVLEALEG